MHWPRVFRQHLLDNLHGVRRRQAQPTVPPGVCVVAVSVVRALTERRAFSGQIVHEGTSRFLSTERTFHADLDLSVGADQSASNLGDCARHRVVEPEPAMWSVAEEVLAEAIPVNAMALFFQLNQNLT